MRRTLYPVAKKARENEENKVRLVRDRLFINNTEYKPKTTTPKFVSRSRQVAEPSYQSRSRARDNQHYQGTRVFKSQNPIIAPPKLNFKTPNRYSVLNDANKQTGIMTESRKQKASSPLENELSVKKLRETESLNAPQQSPQESMDSQNRNEATGELPVLQHLATVLTQEPNSQHVSRDTSPARNVDENNASH